LTAAVLIADKGAEAPAALAGKVCELLDAHTAGQEPLPWMACPTRVRRRNNSRRLGTARELHEEES
jgi:hypothetical protein